MEEPDDRRVALLAAPNKALKGRMVEKTRWRPFKEVEKMMPGGVHELLSLPRRKDAKYLEMDDEQATREYCADVSEAGGNFSRHQRCLGTSQEHEDYILRVRPLPKSVR